MTQQELLQLIEQAAAGRSSALDLSGAPSRICENCCHCWADAHNGSNTIRLARNVTTLLTCSRFPSDQPRQD